VRVLVTGGSGFLGTVLTPFLESVGHEVTSLSSRDCDLTVAGSLADVTSGSYDLIFHLAAWTQAGDFCLRHPGEQWLINQKLNTNILDYWASCQPYAKLVFMGTSCAYAPGSDLRETEFMVGEPIDSLYTYAMTKRMLYQGARALNLQYGLNYLCAVPSTLYGPGYHTDGRQMHFIFDLIRKIIRGREFREDVVLWGDGCQKREIVFASDFVRILWSLCETQVNDIYNIGAGEEFTIRTFAEHICELVGYDAAKIQYDTSRYVGASSKCLNVEKVRAAVPYDLTPLGEGLKDTINWFYETKAYEACLVSQLPKNSGSTTALNK
jgi:GDP-L-fucose synthase